VPSVAGGWGSWTLAAPHMMKFDAFISYSSRDKTAADAACAMLEAAGVRCWIAPRDVRPGLEYGTAIIEAIDQSLVMILNFSSSANESRQIHREIERAVSKGVPVVPVRIEEVLPTKSMEYFLGGIHWLDALTPPLESHLRQLAETVRAILQVDAASRPAPADLATREKITGKATGKDDLSAKRVPPGADASATDGATPTRPRWAMPALAIAACVILLSGGVWVYMRGGWGSAVTPTAQSLPTTGHSGTIPPALGPYHRIVLDGLGATADLVRTGDNDWVWTENNAKFFFHSLLETRSEMMIYDSSRNMYHRLDFPGRKEAWRIGATGEWHLHYDILKVE
jgi:hypothetical protein